MLQQLGIEVLLQSTHTPTSQWDIIQSTTLVHHHHTTVVKVLYRHLMLVDNLLLHWHSGLFPTPQWIKHHYHQPVPQHHLHQQTQKIYQNQLKEDNQQDINVQIVEKVTPPSLDSPNIVNSIVLLVMGQENPSVANTAKKFTFPLVL